jgi:hypothetical protein
MSELAILAAKDPHQPYLRNGGISRSTLYCSDRPGRVVIPIQGRRQPSLPASSLNCRVVVTLCP